MSLSFLINGTHVPLYDRNETNILTSASSSSAVALARAKFNRKSVIRRRLYTPMTINNDEDSDSKPADDENDDSDIDDDNNDYNKNDWNGHQVQHKHVIANHYLDYKMAKAQKQPEQQQYQPEQHYNPQIRRRKTLRSLVIPRNILCFREHLQIPCFVFPRFGENFPWRGRQTLCKNYNNEILSDDLIKIRAATSIDDFKTLLCRHLGKAKRTKIHPEVLNQVHQINTKEGGRRAISGVAEETWNKKATRCGKGRYNNKNNSKKSGKNIKQQGNINKDISRNCQKINTNNKKTTDAIVANNDKDNEENLEWYIQLASQCYNEGFQWHLNFLDECGVTTTHRRRRQSNSADCSQIALLKRHFNTSAEVTKLKRSSRNNYHHHQNSELLTTRKPASSSVEGSTKKRKIKLNQTTIKNLIDDHSSEENDNNIDIDHNNKGAGGDYKIKVNLTSNTNTSTRQKQRIMNYNSDLLTSTPDNLFHNKNGNLINDLCNLHISSGTIDEPSASTLKSSAPSIKSYCDYCYSNSGISGVGGIEGGDGTVGGFLNDNNKIINLPQIILTDTTNSNITLRTTVENINNLGFNENDDDDITDKISEINSSSSAVILSSSYPIATGAAAAFPSPSSSSSSSSATTFCCCQYQDRKKEINSSVDRNFKGTLRIPQERYYRNESRPP